MKKRIAILLLLAAALLGGIYMVSAAGGTATDPLISRSYVDGTYAADAAGRADTAAGQRYDAVYQRASDKLRAQYDGFAARLGTKGTGSYSESFSDQRLKRGDSVTVGTGSGFQLLAGTASVAGTGAVVDVTGGAVQPAGAIVPGRRYLAAENTAAVVTVTSPTAVLSFEGYYNLVPSGETDFNALAGALKTLGLFKGSDTGYGSGYDLEQPPTRIQGLIMFLRLLGEERAALSTTVANPFQDVPAWCAPYVAYAYQQGYTKGVDAKAMLFGTNNIMGAADYVTFVLRALSYQDDGTGPDFTWNTALQSALGLGVITAGEHKMLVEQPFLRAHVAYLSYFALDASFRDSGETLQAVLVSNGVFDQIIVDMVRNGVSVQRVA